MYDLESCIADHVRHELRWHLIHYYESLPERAEFSQHIRECFNGSMPGIGHSRSRRLWHVPEQSVGFLD
jgi:hypothetical protein